MRKQCTLFNECLNFLRENKVIFPAITTLEKLVWGARIEAEKNLFDTVSDSLTEKQKNCI